MSSCEQLRRLKEPLFVQRPCVLPPISGHSLTHDWILTSLFQLDIPVHGVLLSSQLLDNTDATQSETWTATRKARIWCPWDAILFPLPHHLRTPQLWHWIVLRTKLQTCKVHLAVGSVSVFYDLQSAKPVVFVLRALQASSRGCIVTVLVISVDSCRFLSSLDKRTPAETVEWITTTTKQYL